MKDEILIDKKWEFDQNVTDVFDDMLSRSIPQYEVMRTSVYDIGCQFVKQNTDVIDLGCSRGEMLAPFVEKYGAYNHFIGVDISKPMLEVCKERFKGYIDAGVVSVKECDLRKEYPAAKASLTLSVLTLQFTPIEYRQQILRNIFNNLNEGGAFVLIEKVLGNTANLDDLLVKLYLELKGSNEYSNEQIERKRLSLEGVLVPVTAKWNEELLNLAGFKEIDCFWRWMNFAGWVAIK